jgi:diaminopimelate epimerase
VSVGNPHLVVLVDDVTTVDVEAEGSALEAAFPEGINVEFVTVSPVDAMDLVVWERGAGRTQACGSGACAAVAAAQRWGLVGGQVQVRMPGGTATVVVNDAGAVLAGPATWVADVQVPDTPAAATPHPGDEVSGDAEVKAVAGTTRGGGGG